MIDAGNTAWLITATALVLFMTLPGLALFYGGLVRAENLLSELALTNGVSGKDAMEEDPPIAASIELLHALRAYGVRIIYLTGRPEYTRLRTHRWLKANGLDEFDLLLMRPHGERRHAGEFKIDAVRGLRDRYELICAFEDRIDVAEHLRRSGLPVFLYGAGQEAAAEALEILDAVQHEL